MAIQKNIIVEVVLLFQHVEVHLLKYGNGCLPNYLPYA